MRDFAKSFTAAAGIHQIFTKVSAISAIGETCRHIWNKGIASSMYRSALPSLLFCLPSSRPFIAQCGYLAACKMILQYARGEKKTFVIVKGAL